MYLKPQPSLWVISLGLVPAEGGAGPGMGSLIPVGSAKALHSQKRPRQPCYGQLGAELQQPTFKIDK